ncbi:MAG: lactoylglutathione lyase [Gemmatimonadetes bacterium]|nr:lactoylglutathione lyase [Gemmatimonadota bacterium]
MISTQFQFHHLGVAVADMAKSIPIYKTLFNYDVTSGPFDDPIQKVSVCFLSRGAGDMPIELVAPLGPGSPVSATLAKGGSAYHVCYEVPDIAAAIQHLKSNRCVVLAQPVPAVAFDMRKIAWLLTPTQQLIELVEAAA